MNNAGFFLPALMLAVGIIHGEPVVLAAAVFCYFFNRISIKKV